MPIYEPDDRVYFRGNNDRGMIVWGVPMIRHDPDSPFYYKILWDEMRDRGHVEADALEHAWYHELTLSREPTQQTSDF